MNAAATSRTIRSRKTPRCTEHRQRGPDNHERQEQRRKPVLHLPFLPLPLYFLSFRVAIWVGWPKPKVYTSQLRPKYKREKVTSHRLLHRPSRHPKYINPNDMTSPMVI